MTNEEAKAFLDNLKICIDEHPVVADWLVEIADRKTEPQYDFSEYADRLWKIAYERGKREALEHTEPTISKMEQVETMSCQECKHFHENAVMYLDQCDFCFKDCKYEPKDEPQTCGTCKHMGDYEYCRNCCDYDLYLEAQTDCAWK